MNQRVKSSDLYQWKMYNLLYISNIKTCSKTKKVVKI